MGKSYVQWVSTSIFPYISLFQNKLIKILLVQSSKLRSRLPQEATRSDSTRIQQWNNIDIFPDYPATEPPWKSTNLWSSKRKTRTHSKGKTTMVCCYKRLLLNTRSQCIFFGISVTGTKIEDYSLAFQHSKGTITMLSGKSPNYMGHGKSRFLHFANGWITKKWSNFTRLIYG